MTSIQFEDPITGNGDFAFPKLTSAREYCVTVWKDFNDGAVTVGYLTPDDTIVYYQDVEFIDDGSVIVMLPSPGRFVVSVTGSTDPIIRFNAEIVL